MSQPDLETFRDMTETAWANLPENYRKAAGRVVLHVQDLASEDVLREMDISNPMHLSGLYQGVPLTHDSVSFPYPDSARIFLYRKPILAEAQARPDVSLEELIAHVLIHELGHHFGYSDDEMHHLTGEDH
ncbi:MAG: hypothetical protein CMK09_17910 [Ponticaulis sp.]|nr:hypothetical protein [Ponticaulis sp.]|tara:strand:+ start:5832 stop:6221 length:390 start_codon:yes stop_codon:yes gene_type:complete